MAAERIESEVDIRPDKDGKNTQGTRQVISSPQEDEDDLQIEVIDDTPEQDRGRTTRQPGTKAALPDDDEIGQYTKNVQDRMKQMKWEYHEERRAKEAWQREHGAALDFAKKAYSENQKLRKLVEEGHKTLISSTKSSAESEMAAIQESLKGALESGNTALAADLQGKLSKAAARAEAQNHIPPMTFGEPEPAPGTQDKGQQGQQGQRQQVQLSDTMSGWMDENPWFNQNKRMTAFAFGVHEELIDKGIPLESPRYFQEINKSVREAFPNYFEEEEDTAGTNTNGRANQNGSARQTTARTQPRRTTVAGVSRSQPGRTGQRVALTSSELAVAKRMGITPQQYAQEKIRLENQDV